MLAPRPIESSTAAPAAEPASAPETWALLRAASDLDSAAASPVHELQARLAIELDAPRPRLGFDPVRPLIVAVNIACWWGLISLGVLLYRHWPFR
jgi:hypothetical protein